MPYLTAIENVALPLIFKGEGKKEREEKAYQILKDMGLSKRVYNKPNELSGGQQQRVSIARAFVGNPNIIFADEPTGNLDVETGFAITQLLHSISAAGSLVIMTTHNMQLLWEYPGRLYRCADHFITDVTEQYSVASSTEEK